MKKKLIVSLFVLGMCCSLVGCGADKNQNNNAATENVTQETQTEEIASEEPVVDTQENVTDDTVGTDNTDSNSVGQTLLGVFMAASDANANATAQELADAVLADPSIEFMGVTMEVEPGLLSGFGNAEITGFDEGVMFGPMIGSIPFIGYVFTVSEGTDAQTLMNTLRDNADMRWNICTEADETVVESAGQKVFFLMCPASFSEEM